MISESLVRAIAATSTFIDIHALPLLVSVTCTPGASYLLKADKDEYRISGTQSKFVVRQPDGVTPLTTTAAVSSNGSGLQQDYLMSIELQHLAHGRTKLVKIMEASLEQGLYSEVIVLKVVW